MTERTPLSAMTWLEAAEYILRLEGPEMHIRDLTDRVMNLKIVNSSCKTSLETLLYRQTHKPNSKFQRVLGKMGWFKLKNDTDQSQDNYDDDDDDESDDDQLSSPKAVVVKSNKRYCVDHSHDEVSSNSSSSETENEFDEVWKRKYNYLKLLAKRSIMTNVSLAMELEQLENKIDHCQDEKRYLFQKLLDLQSQDCVPKQQQQCKNPPTLIKVKKPKAISKAKQQQPAPPTAPPTAPPPTDKLIYNSITEPSDLFSTSPSETEDQTDTTSTNNITLKQKSKDEQQQQSSGPATRKKRIRRLQPILLKEDGSPVFPIKLGGLQVLSLGKVVTDRPTFHNERYIWPLGFESTRSYPSMIQPSRRCLYSCRILDGGDGPIFEMVSEETPENPIQASSATACHHAVLKAINAARDKQATNAGSGPEFFGFSHPSILNLIQMLPGAEKCTKYKPTIFQQPITRGKGSSGTRKTNSKVKIKSSLTVKPPSSPIGDPSLAPVGLSTQLTNEFSSSLSSDMSDSDSNLVIDNAI